ncbi:hypothetical protein PC116_g30666 [Phytophthora cactorum]|nr:hypothetical protein PC116_g30666 [Phytophthora cactorum]
MAAKKKNQAAKARIVNNSRISKITNALTDDFRPHIQ